MLNMKSKCERCETGLEANKLAYICSFECTFCESCANDELKLICPNCKGELVHRPTRAKALWEKYPPQ